MGTSDNVQWPVYLHFIEAAVVMCIYFINMGFIFDVYLDSPRRLSNSLQMLLLD